MHLLHLRRLVFGFHRAGRWSSKGMHLQPLTFCSTFTLWYHLFVVQAAHSNNACFHGLQTTGPPRAGGGKCNNSCLNLSPRNNVPFRLARGDVKLHRNVSITRTNLRGHLGGLATFLSLGFLPFLLGCSFCLRSVAGRQIRPT